MGLGKAPSSQLVRWVLEEGVGGVPLAGHREQAAPLLCLLVTGESTAKPARRGRTDAPRFWRVYSCVRSGRGWVALPTSPSPLALPALPVPRVGTGKAVTPSLLAGFRCRFIGFGLSPLRPRRTAGRLDPLQPPEQGQQPLPVPPLGFVGGKMQPVPPSYTLN